MSISSTQKALIKHLKTLTPVLTTAQEGVSFTPTTATYQRVQFRVDKPDDPTLGVGYHRERVEMQIFVNTATNRGAGEALERAELLRTHFKKGTTLVQDGVVVHILSTPHIAGVIAVADRLVCPVLIDVTAEVLS